MLLTTFVLWFGVVCLEVYGAYRSRRYRLIFWTLLYIAVSDVAQYVIGLKFRSWYAWTYWFAHAGKYVALALIACYIGSMLVESRPKIQAYAAGLICLTGGALATSIFSQSPTLALKLLDAGLATDFLLAGLLLIAWIEKRGRIRQPWNLIAAGLVVMLAGELLTFGAMKIMEIAHYMIWPGQYAYLLIWIKAFGWGEARIPLGVKVEAQTEKFMEVGE